MAIDESVERILIATGMITQMLRFDPMAATICKCLFCFASIIEERFRSIRRKTRF